MAHNNLFVGSGTPFGGGALSADNRTDDPLFVDRAGFDYHLRAGSPALGKAVDPGSADQFSLVPTSEYEHPLLEVARSGHADVGAYEAAAAGGAGGHAATASAADGGGVRDAAMPVNADAGAAIAPGSAADGGKPVSTQRSASGCSCRALAGTEPPWIAALLTLWLVAMRARARSRRAAARASQSIPTT